MLLFFTSYEKVFADTSTLIFSSFPPKLFKQLSEMFNRSNSPYLICYHCPKLIIDRYGFNVELIVQTNTSMHGSSEGHMGYIYRRAGLEASKKSKSKTSTIGRVLLDGDILSDPLFVNAWKSTRRELGPFLNDVKTQVTDSLSSKRSTRNRQAQTKTNE